MPCRVSKFFGEKIFGIGVGPVFQNLAITYLEQSSLVFIGVPVLFRGDGGRVVPKCLGYQWSNSVPYHALP